MTAKQWLQSLGYGLMLAGVLKGRTSHWWHPKTFMVGVLFFLASLIAWKREVNKDNSDDD